MSAHKKHIIIPLLGLLIGVILPHSDKIVIIFAFSLIFIVPLFLVLITYFIVISIKGYRRKDRTLALNGRTGLLTTTLLLCAPLVSVVLVDMYYKSKANHLITQLKVYKSQEGKYPVKIEEAKDIIKAAGLKYTYNHETLNYALSYSSMGTVTTKYDNERKSWAVHGWND